MNVDKECTDKLQKCLSRRAYRPSEIATLLGMTEAKTWNYYITPLTRSGIIRRQRKGHYTYYSAVKTNGKAWFERLRDYNANLRSKPYVYVLYFDDGCYVGKTRVLETRLQQHRNEFGEPKGVDIIQVGTDEHAAILENALTVNAIAKWGKDFVRSDLRNVNGALDYVKTSVYLPRPFYYALRERAAKKEMTLNEFIANTLTHKYQV